MRRRATESVCALLTEMASNWLNATDREAVCGDLEESGVSGMAALRDVIGLVIRRRLDDFWDCRPWLAFVLLAIPLGALLSLDLRRTADGSAIYVWLYANNWSWPLTQISGFWREMLVCAWNVLLTYVALGCWSWTAGFLVGSYSRRTRWATTSVFWGMLLIIGCFGVPHQSGQVLSIGRAREYPGNAVVFANAFYRNIFPQVLEVLLVALPAWLGMKQSLNETHVPKLYRAAVSIASLVTAFTLVCQSLAWWQLRVWNILPPHLPRLPSLAPLAVAGPMTYLFLIVLRSRWIRAVADCAQELEDGKKPQPGGQ